MLVLAILGCLFFNPPIFEIFSTQQVVTLFGWPLHVIYLYLVWGLLILLAGWPDNKRSKKPSANVPSEEADQGAHDGV